MACSAISRSLHGQAVPGLILSPGTPSTASRPQSAWSCRRIITTNKSCVKSVQVLGKRAEQDRSDGAGWTSRCILGYGYLELPNLRQTGLFTIRISEERGSFHRKITGQPEILFFLTRCCSGTIGSAPFRLFLTGIRSGSNRAALSRTGLDMAGMVCRPRKVPPRDPSILPKPSDLTSFHECHVGPRWSIFGF